MCTVIRLSPCYKFMIDVGPSPPRARLTWLFSFLVFLFSFFYSLLVLVLFLLAVRLQLDSSCVYQIQSELKPREEDGTYRHWRTSGGISSSSSVVEEERCRKGPKVLLVTKSDVNGLKVRGRQQHRRWTLPYAQNKHTHALSHGHK